ncbi:MAG: metallophosphoesterase [Candidatus Pacebacteria bacterium]|nr:metallophosphoesterase [Candidatus Paceibacterota bacterium]
MILHKWIAPNIMILLLIISGPANAFVSELMCSACLATYNLFEAVFTSDMYVQYEREKQIKECHFTPETCAKFFDHNDVVSVINYVKRYNVTCYELGICNKPRIVRQPLTQYQKKVLRDRPPRRYESAVEGTGTMKFAVITDIHIDPNYTQTKSTHCSSTVCCRDDSPDVHNDTDRPGKWGVVGDCDLPFRTLHNAVDDIWTYHKDIKFILWLGDNIANVYYTMNPSDHKFIITNMTTKLLEHYNKLGSVYPVFGNHDSLPRDHMQFVPNASHWLRELCADLWAPWLTPESVEGMRECGHFTQVHPGTHLRIVALNSFVRGSTNSYIWSNITDRCGELSWLQRTLEHSEKAGEKVLIIGHFPPREGFSVNRWTARFSVLMERYANIIVGNMAGHTHEDEYELFRSVFDDEYTGVALEQPSLTSSYSVFPSYRIYEMDASNYQMVDYYQYRLNLTIANAHEDETPRWTLSYSFRNYYGAKNMEDRTFGWLADKILGKENDCIYYKKFAWMMYAEGPNSAHQMMYYDDANRHQVYCWLVSATFERYEDCFGGFSYDDTYDQKVFLPQWEYAV